MKKTITLLIADDHAVVREGLAAVLDGQDGIQVVGQAADGAAAVDLHARLRPDVVLMDLRMPALDGDSATAAILSRSPGARVLVLTSFEGDEDIHRALAAGACGYLLKRAAAREIVSAVRAAAEGLRVLPRAVVDRLAERMPRSDLSPRELEVLRQIVEGRSNREIGEGLGVAESTVKTYVDRLFGKLGVRDRTQAASVAVRRGIIRIEP